MPISHPHKAIFVHIPKTAGTSIEAVLGMHGKKQDVGVVPYFNQVLDHEHLYGGPMQHMTAQAIKAVLSDDGVFHAYFKFTIVRNPWDRLVSALAWTDQKWVRGEELAVAEFDRQVREIHTALHEARSTARELALPHFVHPQCLYVMGADGRPLVDFVGKYETLEADWQSICAKLGISVRLPRRMQSHHRDYREYYNEETRHLVGEMFAADVRLFRYEF